MRLSARSRRHARPMERSTRATATSLGVALAVTSLVVTSLVTTAPVAAANTVDPCNGQWAPALRSVVVSQGSRTIPPLVRGKTTIVRLFLSAPACAPAGNVQLIAGSLQPVVNGADLGAAVATTPSALGPAYPAFAPVDLPIAPENQANPLFQLPAFGAGGPTGEFTARFRATITYRYQLSPTDVRTAQVVYGNEANTLLQTTVAPASKPLRILLVPMGNGGGSSGTAPGSQFPMASPNNGGTPVNGQYAEQTVQKGMLALAQMMPVPDGVGDLTNTTAGLRYRLNVNAMIDLSVMTDPTDGLPVLDSDGRFCGDATRTIPVDDELSKHLSTWNSTKNNPKADRAVGVIWQAASKGGGQCAEGWAKGQAWVRTFADRLSSGTNPVLGPRSAGVSMTGPLLGMELIHSFGGVSRLDTERRAFGNHSKYVGADPQHTLETYLGELGRWLPAPLSVMRYSGDSSGYSDPAGPPNPWNNASTLLEREDYRFTQCALTPGMTTGTSGQCPHNETTGTLGGAAQGSAFVLAGLVDLNALTAGDGFGSYLASAVEITPPAAHSDVVLVQRDAADKVISGALGRQQVPVTFETSVHHDGSESLPAGIGSINAAVQTAAGVAHFELWRRPAGADETWLPPKCLPHQRPDGCLYARSARTTPVVTSTTGSSRLGALANFSNAAGDDETVALSPDGRLVVWSAPDATDAPRLVLQRRDPARNAPLGAPVATGVAGFDPSFSSDGKKLVFANVKGDLLVSSVVYGATEDVEPSLGTPRVVYDRRLQVQPPVGTAAARYPTFDPSGQRIAAEINGGVWAMHDADTTTATQVQCDLASYNVTLTCEPLVRSGGAPAWRWPAADSPEPAYIAFDGAGGVRTLDPAHKPALPGTDYASVLRVPGGRSAAWGRHLLVFSDSSGISVADTRDEAPDGTWLSTTRITACDTDANCDADPAVSANDEAIAFDRGTASHGRDVFVGTRGDDEGVIRFEASTTDDSTLLRADILIDCVPDDDFNGNDVVLAGLRPKEPTRDGEADFEFHYTDRFTCPGGVLYARVNNGYNLGQLTPIRYLPEPPSGQPPVLPSPAIGSPAPGSTYLQYDAVLATASNVVPRGTNQAATAEWRLTGPAGSGYSNTVVAPPGTTPSRLALEPPVPHGWVPGRYDLTLSVTIDGRAGTTSTYFFVLPDQGHTGRTVGVRFDPQTLFVPSNGNDVTLTLTSNGLDLSALDPSTVKITEVGNVPTSLPMTSKLTMNKDGTYQAKFSRQQLTCAMHSNGLSSGYVRVVIAGTGPGLSMRGYDPQYPNVTPTSPPATC